jgi:hypothetical protein
MTDGWKEIPRLAITGVILALFAYGVVIHWGTGLEETLKNVTLLAVGFWLGSSKGSTDSAARTDKALDIAATAQANNGEPTVTLKPGETAQAEEAK